MSCLLQGCVEDFSILSLTVLRLLVKANFVMYLIVYATYYLNYFVIATSLLKIINTIKNLVGMFKVIYGHFPLVPPLGTFSGTGHLSPGLRRFLPESICIYIFT